MDIQIFFLINHLPHPPFLDWLVGFIHFITLGGKLYFATGILLLASKNLKLRQLAFLGLAVGILTYVANDLVLKEIFNRARPFETLPNVIYVPTSPANSSFPSGQTAVAFALATLIYLLFPKGRGKFWAFGFALLVAVSRIYMGHHYPSDTIVGAGLGYFIAYFVYHSLKHKLSSSKKS
jgi:undecaprenyl-diphosphatase